MSTDDEQINSEVAKFNTEKERLTNDIKTAFDDVVDEFCNIPQIISKIERWKKEQNDSYVQAYIGLCLPRFLTPLIKVQLAVWNPLEQYCRNFEKLPWYQDLLNYGTIKENSINKIETESKSLEKPISQNSNNNDVTVNGDDLSSTTTTTTTAAAATTTTTTSTANDKNSDNNVNDVNGRGKMVYDDAGDEEDMDIKLIPNIVDKLLLPRINGLVESVWDPMSLQQTTNLSNVIKQVTVDYPIEAAQSKSLQSLICSINKRIMKSINDDLFIPLYPKSVLENKTSESTMFFNRQVYSCLKLMKSIVLWQNVISDQQLQSLTLDKILNRYLMIAMSSAPANIELISLCQKISQLIPQEWFTEYMEGITLPQLENFCKFIVTWATNLKAQMKSNSDAKEQIKQLGRILLRLHAEAHATALSKLIGFKITIN
ncbi:hypothetical protein HELRODRAFT_93667 [Helobdella robusta]|uniref:GCF C-terminal domain-containing protein n=1 Tax=Helobdella robusta TaxID=6412 RepID=T1G8X2_HELRO|nr:hypothetical protein HELRODRAFT_93667 [Helobdella robusta]ESO13113.1 hypothetical protein HELRODRAFT_93667 [Helobdella robusta]